MTILFGVDIGLKGAIVRLNDDGSLIDSFVMPRKEGKIDWLRAYEILSPCSFGAIELVHSRPTDSKKGAFSFGGSFEGIRACLLIASVPFVEVDPRRWKNAVLSGTDKSKDSAINFCMSRFPGINLMPGRMTTHHDGLADAACIAEWCFLNREGENSGRPKRSRTKGKPAKRSH